MDIEAPALATIRAYSWPGNIRQLENIVERLVVLNRSGTILTTDLPNEMRIAETERTLPAGGTYGLHAVEREAVVSALNPRWPLQNPPPLVTQNPPGRTCRLSVD